MNGHTGTSADDGRLLADLRSMWERLDPPPRGLVDDVLVTLATADVADEYEVLTLVSDARELAGTRGDGEARVLEFTATRRDGAATVLLRVSPLEGGPGEDGPGGGGPGGGGDVRIDGWVVPGRAGSVLLERDAGDDATAVVSAEGRFEFARVPAGAARLTVSARQDAAASVPLVTPDFEL
ncbi:hypothetical protein HD599_001212 [Conyzicola lurida]|uniref:Carboxypeptidase regulatory-like domain-containing protein n=1 Tax=Conyzicola lurida TaxID=1172621 RepID=A0A841AN88_9MICO|nr:hypothetical protein [Conyzicola lurida]MBB5842889.1 hypothetical protein [Conyzicola lurida]